MKVISFRLQILFRQNIDLSRQKVYNKEKERENMKRENEKIEFKKTTAELNEGIVSIASILNKHKKGELYFGIKNNGEPFEFTINDSTIRDISRKIYEGIKPQIYPTITTVLIEGIEVIKVEFSGEDIPYSAFGRYYIRIADEDRELTPNELKKIMVNKEYEEHWENKDSGYSLEDIDNVSLKRFYREAIECGRLPDLGFDNTHLLNVLGLSNGDQLNNAGAYLFSNKSLISMKLVVFATDARETILDMNLIKGNIFNLIDDAMQFIIKNIRWRVDTSSGNIRRREIPEIPLEALREAVINSFAHARYDGNVQHEIDIYSNRISIINPGSFANEFTPLDFYQNDLKSYLRNQKIAETLYFCKNVEACGHGLKTIYKLCNEKDVSIGFIKNENDFTLEFSRVDRNSLDTTVDDNVDVELNEKEIQVLTLIRKDNYCTKEKLIETTSISSRSIDRIISSLKNKGLLTRVGSNKSGYWKVN